MRHLIGILWLAGILSSFAYDPMAVVAPNSGSVTLEVRDPARNRTLPLRAYLPKTTQEAPVILFSHGLGGSRDNGAYLGNHWSARGYVVVFVQHPGSDESVWKDAPLAGRMAAMRQAASAENFLARNRDIPVVLDALERWNQQKGHPLFKRCDLKRVGMSGHSFGAVTTQAVAGQSTVLGKAEFREPRIDAAVMFSPSPPKVGDLAKAFASISIPCLLMTGTEDSSPIGNTTPADRLKVFPYLKQAPAWQVNFFKATHMDFGEREGLLARRQDPRYHRAILALSTAFWDATLKKDEEAVKWLKGKNPRSVLIAEDTWESNGR